MPFRKTLFIIFTSLSISSQVFAQEKLLFAIDLIRHGDRYPLAEIPASPLYTKDQLGQLSSLGAEQEKQLGRKLRQTYVDKYHLLPNQFEASRVYVRSTDIQRTKDSAAALFEGLYPKQKIQIHFVPRKDDSLLLIKLNDWGAPFDYKYFTPHDIQRWEQQTKMSLKNFSELDDLADNLSIRKLKNLPMPKGISTQDAATIITASERNFVGEFKSHQRTDVMGNLILQTASDYFSRTIQKKERLRYVLWSAHDTTLMGIMNTLNAPLQSVPGYASRVNFSLFENHRQYYVRVSFNDRLVKTIFCGKHTCSLQKGVNVH